MDLQSENSHPELPLSHQSQQRRSERHVQMKQSSQLQLHQEFTRRDIELSSEIDRLFADETPAPPTHPKLPDAHSEPSSFGQSTNHHPRTEDSGFSVNSTNAQRQNRGPSSIEDAAVTLASVAYFSSSSPGNVGSSSVVEEGRHHPQQTQPVGDISFEDFAKQLAAGAQSCVVERETDEADQLTTVIDGHHPEKPSPQPQSCLLYTSPSPRDQRGSRMPSSA